MGDGSSPRVRGLLKVIASAVWNARIIPARAGFTTPSTTTPHSPSDHPRACGVYFKLAIDALGTVGSSPRVRGLLPHAGDGVTNSGIIPARAGFTARARAYPRLQGDHPRACGVYAGLVQGRPVRGGSSPRVRGLLAAAIGGGAASGIIPARAGFTPCARARSPSRADHPRACGVYVATHTGLPSFRGSSPRVRGLLGLRGGMSCYRPGSSPRVRGLPCPGAA